MSTIIKLQFKSFHHRWGKNNVLETFQFILVFGSQTVTATVKELLAYTGFYVEKALKDAALSGLPLTLHNFNDGVMETKHKEAKQGTDIYSGGRVGETGKIKYQKWVLTQQFCHEWASVENREKKGVQLLLRL